VIMKRYFVLCVLTELLTVGLIPFNLFVLNMPEYVMVIASVLMVASFVLFIKKSGAKSFAKALMGGIIFVLTAAALFCSYCNPYWNSLLFKEYPCTENFDRLMSFSQAKADIDAAMHYLQKDHPVFLNGDIEEITRAYEKAVNELRKSDVITVTTVNQKLQNILSLLNDAHTCAYANYREYHYFKHIGSRNNDGFDIAKVNGVKLEELLEQKAGLFSYEAKSWGLQMLKDDLMTLEGLAFLGIDPREGVEYTFVGEQGQTETAQYDERDFITWQEYKTLYGIEAENNEPFVSYAIDKERSLAVLTLRKCRYNDEYRRCLGNMFAEIKQDGLRNVAVDIRGNGGGSSLVADEFLRYLDIDEYKTDTGLWRFGMFNFDAGGGLMANKKNTDLLFCGNVYVLTSADTFSSAMMFAEYVKDNGLGKIIGEAPGNAPSGYGDTATFVLPNSRLLVQISTKQFQRADKNTDDIWVSPDIACDADNAMDVLYRVLS